MKPILFVPGFQEHQQSRNYEAMFQLFRDNGYAPRFVDIDWRRTTQTDWVRQLNDVRMEVGFDAPLAGFSFGAVTALLSAVDHVPSELWLFSLSPLFAECSGDWTKTDKRVVGKRRLNLATTMPLSGITRKVTCPIHIFLGEKEARLWPDMRRCFEQVLTDAPQARGASIDGAGHAIEETLYVEAVRQRMSQA